MRVADSVVKPLIVCCCAVVAVACGGKGRPPAVADRPQPPKTYVFECLNKSAYTVRFEQARATIFLPVGTVTLPRQTSSAGAKYSDGKTSIWQRGEIALMHIGGKPLGDCYNNPREAAWEHARLNGVDFRAVGDKPGWVLEVTDRERIVFESGQGGRRIEFPFVAPKVGNASLTRTYESKTERHRLTVTAVEMECKEPLSAKIHDWTVTVTLDGVGYNGCGKALQ